MLEFEPFTLEGLIRIQPYLHRGTQLCSDLTAGSLLMWQEGTDMRFCVWNDTFTVRQDVGEQPAFSWPIGADPDGMIDELIAYTRENNLALRFFAIDGDLLETIGKDGRLQPFAHAFDRSWSDYLYSFESAATFAGKKFSGQRNHINHFKKLYGEPEVRFLRPEDRPALDRMVALYENDHKDGFELEKLEFAGTKRLIDAYEKLGLYAACLVVGGEIAAFSIGEVIHDALVIHVEKALLKYEGAYPTMYNGFVRLVGDRLGHPLQLVNREDDSGNPGLRMSKLQYHPVGMVDKYLVHVHSPAARLSGIPDIPAGEVVLTAMRETDKDAYFELNTDIENNRLWGYDYREDLMLTGPINGDLFYESVQYDMAAGDSINFALRLSKDGDLIGEGILWQFLPDGSAEIGLRLMPQYHGKGYGRAAFSALADFAERELGLKCRARCFLENTPSYHMITESGFRMIRQDESFYYFSRA